MKRCLRRPLKTQGPMSLSLSCPLYRVPVQWREQYEIRWVTREIDAPMQLVGIGFHLFQLKQPDSALLGCALCITFGCENGQINGRERENCDYF